MSDTTIGKHPAVPDRDALIEAHLHLVEATRDRIFGGRGVDRYADDLEGAGYLALTLAAARYDPARGTAFPTWAISYIAGAMKEWLRKDDWLPRAARAEAKAGGDYVRLVSLETYLLTQTEDGAPSAREIPQHEMLASEEPGPEEMALATVEAERVRFWLNRLPPKERVLIYRHYYRGETLISISRRLGVSASRSHQIHREALERLRRLMSGDRGASEASAHDLRVERGCVQPKPVLRWGFRGVVRAWLTARGATVADDVSIYYREMAAEFGATVEQVASAVSGLRRVQKVRSPVTRAQYQRRGLDAAARLKRQQCGKDGV